MIRFRFLLFLFSLFASSLFAQGGGPATTPDPEFKSVVDDFSKGRWESARSKLERLSTQRRDNSDLEFLWGKYYHQKQEYSKARYHLQKSLKRAPNDLEAKQLLVNVETASQRYSSAVCYVNELLEVNPYWKSLWLKKIEIYEAQGNLIQAERLLKRLFQIYPEDVEIRQKYVDRAKEKSLVLSKTQDHTGAIKLKEELLSADPRDVGTVNGLFNDYLRSGQLDKAVALMDQAMYMFPAQEVFLLRKVSILSTQQRFSEVLYILEQRLKTRPSPEIRRQYNYYMQEAARYSLQREPEQLYGKIFQSNPSNVEAFQVVYNAAVSAAQYDEALSLISQHRRFASGSKNLDLKELQLFKLKGDELKTKSKIRELYIKYPGDTDIAYDFARVTLADARQAMETENWSEAIILWDQVQRSGDREMKETASNSLISAYSNYGKYEEAEREINSSLELYGDSPYQRIRLMSLYFKMKQYERGLEQWSYVLQQSDPDQQNFYRQGLGELMQPVLKELSEAYDFEQERLLAEKWRALDSTSVEANKAVATAYIKTNRKDLLNPFLEEAVEKFPNDLFFSDKLLTTAESDENNTEILYSQAEQNLSLQPYTPALQNTFVEKSVDFSKLLLKDKQSTAALEVLDKAMKVQKENSDLITLKGAAFQQQKRYDSAYYYTAKYTPSVAELGEYKQNLRFLQSHQYTNELEVNHLVGRFQDTTDLTSVSSFNFRKKISTDLFGFGVHYAGRTTGQGVQVLGSWERPWTEKFRTSIEAGYASKFFNKLQISAQGFYRTNLLQGSEGKLGIGYRSLEQGSLLNANVGISKELEKWVLDATLGNYVLESKYLYNFTLQARHLLGNPKSYLLLQSGIGTAPQVEVLNTKLYQGLSADNVSVTTGIVHMLSAALSGGISGSFYHYKTAENYRNLYNVNLTLNVRF